MSDGSISPEATLELGRALLPYYESPFWGSLVSLCLVGVSLCQAWTYATSNKDHWSLRTLVAVLVIFDLVSIALQAQWIHYYLMQNYGIPTALFSIAPTGAVAFLFSYTINYIVDLFFATRVYLLTRNKWMSLLIFIAGSISYGGGLGTIVFTILNPNVTDFATTKVKVAAGIFCGFSFLSSASISVALSRSFYGSRSEIKGYFRKTSDIVRHLLYYIVTRGILLCALQTALLILFLLFPTRMYWIAVTNCSSRLYILTLLYILNSRRSFRRKFQEGLSTDISLSGGTLVSRLGGGYTSQDPESPCTPLDTNDKKFSITNGGKSEVGVVGIEIRTITESVSNYSVQPSSINLGRLAEAHD